eukprot:g2112.t1
MKYWAQIGRDFGGTSAGKNVSNNIKRAFSKWLLPYEKAVFPEEAMSSSGKKSDVIEKTTSSFRPRKRDRYRSCPPVSPTNIEKKSSRSSYTQQYEENSFNQETIISTGTGTSSRRIEPRCLTNLPPLYNSLITLPYQRSYVSLPHITGSKFCIILLPSNNEEEISSGTLFGSHLYLNQQQDHHMNGQATPFSDTRPGRGSCFKERTELQVDDNNNINDGDHERKFKCDHTPLQFQDLMKQKLQRQNVMETNNEHYSQETIFREPVKREMPESTYFTSWTTEGRRSKDLINDSCISSDIRDQRFTSQGAGINLPAVKTGDSVPGLFCLYNGYANLGEEGETDRGEGRKTFTFTPKQK